MANYTDADRVRLEAGLVGNTNISNVDDIDPLIDQSHGIILGTLAATYDTTLLDSSNADFSGSQAENLLKRVEELLAAGYLLFREYSLEGDGSDNAGHLKFSEGKELLAQIIDKDVAVKLLDNNGDEFTTQPSSSAGTIEYTGNTTEPPKFTINDQY